MEEVVVSDIIMPSSSVIRSEDIFDTDHSAKRSRVDRDDDARKTGNRGAPTLIDPSLSLPTPLFFYP
jgi:hypothetical protein